MTIRVPVLLLALARIARAQETPSAEAVHLLRGNELLVLKQFDEAISEYMAGYAINHDPKFLYNIGQAQRLGGHCEQALASYRAFLRTDPPDDFAMRARKNIDTCRAQVASAPPPPRPAPTPIVPPAPPPQVAARAEPPHPPVMDLPKAESEEESSHWPAYLIGGGGVALVVTGALLASSAAGDYERLRTSCAPWCSPSSWDGLDTKESAGYALVALGGAAIAGGVVIWLLESSSTERSERVWISPTVGGFAAGGRF